MPARPRSRHALPLTALCLGLLLSSTSEATAQAVDRDARVLPRHAHPYGLTHEEWMQAYRVWHSGIPAESSPILDATGDNCSQGQSGPVWFLAHRISPGVAVRDCSVPAGKALYLHPTGILGWLPEDLGSALFIAEFLGLDSTSLTEEELLRAVANWFVDQVTVLTIEIDGVELQNVESYRAQTTTFDMVDTDLYDDLGIPYSHPNQSIAVGFGLVIAPLPPGEHTIEMRAEADNPLLGFALFDITYHLQVGVR